MSDWIDVNDRLPPSGEHYSSEEFVLIAYIDCYGKRSGTMGFHANKWYDCSFESNSTPISNVTHWQPFPQLPEE